MQLLVRYLLILFIQVTLTNCYAVSPVYSWEASKLNTASKALYLSSFEKEIIFEINKLRSDPARYAAEFIAPLAKHYKHKLLHYPGDLPLLTREGVSALSECVRELERHRPLPPLNPDYELTRAARDHVKDQSKTGRTGHIGSDKSSMRERIERYGKWQTRIAENIAYGGKSPQQIIIYLLIDDGIRDRGHRKNFLNPELKIVGVATGGHPEYGIMCVMDFAGGLKSKTNEEN